MGAESREKVVLKVFSLPTGQEANPQKMGEYRIYKRFQELHPWIEVVSSTRLMIQGDRLDAVPLMAIAGGTSPDVLYVNFRLSDTYIRQGFLVPLDEYVARMSPGELAERVPESVMPVIRRAGEDGKTHYWAMPQQTMAVVLAYRRDLFQEAGLDPDRPPRDWKEFMEDAKRLTNPVRGIHGTAFLTGENMAWSMYSYLCSAGARAVKQLPNGEWRADFDTSEAVDAYEFTDALQKTMVEREGQSGPVAYRTASSADVSEKWMNGKIGMMFTYLRAGQLGNFDPQRVGVALVPRGPSGKSSSEVNAQMLGIFAGQKDPRVREAAWEWIRFTDSMEARKIFTQTMVQYGAWRMLSPAWLRKFGFSALARRTPPGLEEAFDEAMEQGTPEPYGRNCQQVYSYMSRPMDKIYHAVPLDLPMEERRAEIRKILQTAVGEADERMMGIIPGEVRQKRNSVAWLVALAGGAAFLALLRQVFRWVESSRPPGQGAGVTYKDHWAMALVAPALILMLMWQYWPLMRGSAMAFQDYSLMGGSPWVGMDNFADVLHDRLFWLSLRNSIYFCALWMVLGFLPPLFLAVMLQEIRRGRMLFRTLFYLPAILSSIVVLFMWRGIYDKSPSGVLNQILMFFELPPQAWLEDPRLAMVCVVFPLAWANMGPASILYLAALKGIPEELYEASEMDGAGFTGKLLYVVLPYLKPLLIINMVGALIFGFKSGDAVMAMTGGGPNLATHVLGWEIFQRTFLHLEFGRGAAMAWILGLLLLAFTAHQLKILHKVEFRSTRR